ncbi:MAG: FtsX-like permease family protein, partial [Cyclobacteriaceae bacterium]|nr:FtsX-like permease family protein [Cyclobacteriaceae bacterium]
YELQPITSIHLYSKIQDEVETGGNINTIYAFSVIAVLMLIIACINYMNLATARYSKRAREVGIRKVAGSSKIQLVLQFLSESLLFTFLATVLSVLLIYLFLPQFNEIANKQIPFSTLFKTNLVFLLPSVVLITGILGGSYPAFYLSSFKPVNVLKGKMTSKGGVPGLRKILVIFQFFISVGMLTSTLLVYRQLEFLSNKDLGFVKEQVVLIEMPDSEIRKKFQPLKDELLSIPEVRFVSTASSAPSEKMLKMELGVETNIGTIEEIGVDFYFIGFDFIETLGLEIIEGRNLDAQFPSDTLYSVLVTEAMVSRMNWDEPLGKKFRIPVFGQDTTVMKEVVGVIKNYHQNSLYDQIVPLTLVYRKSNDRLCVKIDGNDISNTIQKIEIRWKSIHPDKPFTFNFLDESLEAQYDQDERRGKLFTVFSALAIFIACLGLLGLTAFTTEQRTKEISIRKVNGASNRDLVILVAKDFLKLVFIGTALALPAAWYFMDNWLENFAYKIVLWHESGIALQATFLIIIATLLTVGYHTIRAANENPARALGSD